jgi:hypothetical protein
MNASFVLIFLEHCIMEVPGMVEASKTEVDEAPFDEMASSRPLDQFDLDHAEAEVTLAGGQPVQLPDGTYGVIKHLAHSILNLPLFN